ncbi:MAG: TrkH family potassium uptake protein, partial [Gammaproteobacteria bacterium]
MRALYPISYAVRLPVVGKYLGQLALLLAALTAVPLAVALFLGEGGLALRLALVTAVLLASGIPAIRLPAPAFIQENEAFAVVGLAYLLAPVFMAWPLTVPGIPLLDAFFEATSGITTTGLSTLASVEDKPPGFIFARAWLQWYGGLGIAVLSVALMMGHHVAARRLFQPEAEEATLVTTTRTHARRVLLVYAILTLLAFLILWPALGEAFPALLHTLAAVSTGG